MTQVVHAIFENGVLRPLEALQLREHEEVRVVVEAVSEAKSSTPDDDDPLSDLRISTGISDLAEQFDRYRFGSNES